MIWTLAGLDSLQVKKTTIVNWMQLGCYKSREKLFQQKIVKSDVCLACDWKVSENLYHLLFLCPHYEDIRQPILTRLLLKNNNLTPILEDKRLVVTMILDPESNLLPNEITSNWKSTEDVYGLCRDLCYHIHRKREKLYNEKDKMTVN